MFLSLSCFSWTGRTLRGLSLQDVHRITLQLSFNVIAQSLKIGLLRIVARLLLSRPRRRVFMATHLLFRGVIINVLLGYSPNDSSYSFFGKKARVAWIALLQFSYCFGWRDLSKVEKGLLFLWS